MTHAPSKPGISELMGTAMRDADEAAEQHLIETEGAGFYGESDKLPLNDETGQVYDEIEGLPFEDAD